MDLRWNTVLDVTRSIWVLASNKGDDLISKFYEKNLNGKSDSDKRHVSIKPLQHDLYKLFIEAYTVSWASQSAFRVLLTFVSLL